MPLIDQYRKNAPRARFLSSQELQDLVRAKTPFYLTDVFEGKSTFNGKEVAKWNFRAVPLVGGAEFLFSMGRTGYRDGLVEKALQPEIAKSKTAGPFILTFGINKNSGRPMYDLEDFAMRSSPVPTPATPAPSVVVATPKQVTAHCPLCDTWPVSDQPFNWDGKLYIPHECPVSGKGEMLVVEET